MNFFLVLIPKYSKPIPCGTVHTEINVVPAIIKSKWCQSVEIQVQVAANLLKSGVTKVYSKFYVNVKKSVSGSVSSFCNVEDIISSFKSFLYDKPCGTRSQKCFLLCFNVD